MEDDDKLFRNPEQLIFLKPVFRSPTFGCFLRIAERVIFFCIFVSFQGEGINISFYKVGMSYFFIYYCF